MPSFASTIRATRGKLASSQAASRIAGPVLQGRRLAFYNGAFSPPTMAHAHIVASLADRADCVWMDVEPASARKRRWMDEIHDLRVQMCEAMVTELELSFAGVGTMRSDLGRELGNSAELFRTLRALLGGSGELYWGLGADVAEGMRHWRAKVEEFTQPGVTCDGLVVFLRAGSSREAVREALAGLRCQVELVEMPAKLAATSSHHARRALVSASRGSGGGDHGAAEAEGLVPPSVAALCLEQPQLMEAYREQVASLGAGGFFLAHR